jgi:hypothetical protein
VYQAALWRTRFAMFLCALAFAVLFAEIFGFIQ